MAARTAGRGLSIGQVLRALQPEFPDISISKIRFLEAEGLLTPSRTGSGYRTYAAQDVDRLRYILTAQRDRFWPLKVIREALDAIDRGLTPEGDDGPTTRPTAPRPAEDPDLPSADSLAARTNLRLTGAELRSASGLDQATFEALESFGLLRADESGHFGEGALAVAHHAAALAAYGIEPRHLRPFRTAADREIGLVQQVISPLRGKPGGPPKQDPTGDILRLCIALHASLVKDGLAHR